MTGAGRYAPVTVGLLAERLAAAVERCHPDDRPLRLALDGPACADTAALIALLTERLQAAGRPVGLVDSRTFYRDASLRLEYGRTDVESFYRGWLDDGALRREVLDPIGTSGRYLPSLRDPVSNRSTRAQPVELATTGVLLVRGQLLLGIGLPFDLTAHFSVSRQARRRLTDPELQWTLPAFDRYDHEVDPAAIADLVIRYDDPRHPALLDRTGS